MWVQKLIWFLGRFIFFMLLIPILIGIVYTLSHDQWRLALIFMVLCILILYKGLIRIGIPENSIVLRDGKVVFYIPEKTVRDRFDFASRGQTIAQLPHYGLLNRPYKLEIFSPDDREELISCRLSLNLGYIMEVAGWQKVYDNYLLYQDNLAQEVRKKLFKSSARISWPSPVPGEGEMTEYLQPVVAELNLGLENFGLKIEEATCTFMAGPTFIRFVAAEQEMVEKAAVRPGAA